MTCSLKEAVVELTSQCNMHCLHCGSDCQPKAASGELSISEWCGFLDQFKALGGQKVVFSGGEPILKSGLGMILDHARTLNLRFGVITNGFAVRQIEIDILTLTKPFAVAVSIDGTPDIHNQIRGHNESWDRSIATIKALKKAKIPVCVITTVNRMNLGCLPVIGKMIDDLSVPVWQIQLAMPSGRMRECQNLLISDAEFEHLCRLIYELRKQYRRVKIEAADCFGMAPADIIREQGWSGCQAGISAIGLDACGNVLPCLSLYGQENSVGNLRQLSLAEIWQGPGFDWNRKFNPADLGQKCQDCRVSCRCRGGCASQSRAYFGHFHESPFCFERSFWKELQAKGVEYECS